MPGHKAKTLMTFLKELSTIFGGSAMSNSAAVKCTKKSFLPTLPTLEDWESKNNWGGGGLKPIIKIRMKSVKARVVIKFGSHLGSYPWAKVVALANFTATT